MSEQHEQLVDILGAYRFNFVGERQLQDGIEAVLQQESIAARREVRLSGRDRIDFLTGGVGIEVKTAGSSANLLRQLARYAEHDEIRSLIVVTNRSHLACVGQAEFDGDKNVSVVLTSRRAF